MPDNIARSAGKSCKIINKKVFLLVLKKWSFKKVEFPFF